MSLSMTNTMQIFREQQFNNNERDTKMLNLNEQLFNTNVIFCRNMFYIWSINEIEKYTGISERDWYLRESRVQYVIQLY